MDAHELVWQLPELEPVKLTFSVLADADGMATGMNMELISNTKKPSISVKVERRGFVIISPYALQLRIPEESGGYEIVTDSILGGGVLSGSAASWRQRSLRIRR